MGSAAKCLAVLKLVLIERLVYRLIFFLQVLSGVLTSLIIIFLRMAVYRGNSVSSLGGYTMPEMITYLLGGGLINTFILTTAENNETSQTIADGTLSGLLVQPFSPYWVWFFRDMGTKLFSGADPSRLSPFRSRSVSSSTAPCQQKRWAALAPCG